MEKWLTDKGPGTHVLMDGGILQVPFEQLDEFYVECIHAVRLGKKLYVVSKRRMSSSFSSISITRAQRRSQMTSYSILSR